MESACQVANRTSSSLRLLAVSKTQSVEKIRALAHLGQADFGENYVDEALPKVAELASLGLKWHFIGPIQSNKTRAIAEHFDWVQSIDRPKIVRRLAEQRPEHLGPLKLLIQVNLDGERQKAGCHPDEISELADQILACPALELRGLMAIPAPREDHADQLAVFRKLRTLYEELARQHSSVDTLSAGMTADLEAAVEAGSTMVRVGTALFGGRA
jgi:PLP dependent protein